MTSFAPTPKDPCRGLSGEGDCGTLKKRSVAFQILQYSLRRIYSHAIFWGEESVFVR